MLTNRIVQWVEARADPVARSPFVLIVFSILFFLLTSQIAANKLLWNDELFTAFISTSGDLHEILRVLATGADQHPPLFYYLTQLVLHSAGMTHITVRLPAMIGFWLMCICLYWIVRRLTTPMWGLIAMLAPMCTTSYYYATEARGYGLMLGFVALALLSWMAATDGGRRKVFIPLLALSLAAAVSSHYYAVLSLFPLCLAEVVRMSSRRKIDFAILVGFTGAIFPILMFLPTIRSASIYSHHFWAVPAFQDLYGHYRNVLGWFSDIFVAALVVAVVCRSLGRRSEQSQRKRRSMTPWVAVALAGLFALPLFTLIIALSITHAYTERYALGSLIGAVILLCWFLFHITVSRPIAPVMVLLLLVTFAGVQFPILVGAYRKSATDLAGDVAMFRRVGNVPCVIFDPTIFFRFSFYAPRNLTDKVVYVSDPDAAVRYLGYDTVDRGFLDLKPWFPLNVTTFDRYMRRTPNFIAYGSFHAWDWLPYRFNHTDLIATLLQRREGNALFLVHNGSRPLPSSEGTRSEQPDWVLRTQPWTKASLCASYMSARECPAFP